MITMKGISKTYRVRARQSGMKHAVKGLFSRAYTEIQAIKDMTFTIPDGQIVGYIGPNGAGKSTIFAKVSGSSIWRRMVLASPEPFLCPGIGAG